MDVHILNGNGFGGVESLFFNTLNIQKKKSNVGLYFLGEVPEQFKTDSKFSDMLLRRIDFIRKRREIRAIIPHADYKGLVFLLSLKLILRFKIVAVSHGVIRAGTSNKLVFIVLSALRLIANAFVFDEKIAISSISARDYFIGDHKVISYTPEGAQFNPREADLVLRPLRLCCVGRFHSSWKIKSAKNQEYVFRILERLDSIGFSYEMLFVGSGQEFDALIKKYRPKGSVERIEYSDNDILSIANSDLLLAPSNHESFGQTILWSQMVGTPALVSSNVCHEVDIGGCTYLDISDISLQDWCEYITKAERTVVHSPSQDYAHMKISVYQEYLARLESEANRNCS